VLSALSESSIPLSLTELSRLIPQSLSSLQRITFTLQQLGYLIKDLETKKYNLGQQAISLGFSIIKNFELKQIASPFLKSASEEIGETVNLAILDGLEIIYVERVKTQQILNINLEVGSRLPAFCTAMGKAMLAFLPEDQLENILRKIEFKSIATKALKNEQRLRRDLKKVRDKGFAVNNQELADGLRSVAAPVRNYKGEVIAAVNIAVPTIRVSLENLETVLAEKVKEIAGNISSAIGYKQDP